MNVKEGISIQITETTTRTDPLVSESHRREEIRVVVFVKNLGLHVRGRPLGTLDGVTKSYGVD